MLRHTDAHHTTCITAAAVEDEEEVDAELHEFLNEDPWEVEPDDVRYVVYLLCVAAYLLICLFIFFIP